MIQQVDLLGAELAPSFEPMAGGHLVASWGGFVLVLAVITVWQAITVQSLRVDAAETQRAVGEIRAMNDAVEVMGTEQLEVGVVRLMALHEEQLELVSLLQGHEPRAGFASYFRDLAAVEIPGLWLKSITVRQAAMRAVELRGGARQAELVPEFLKRLGDAESFDGQRFGRIEITETADDDAPEGVVDFAVLAPVRDPAS